MTSEAIDPDKVEQLRHAHDLVLARIAAAAQRAGRDPGEVTLVAVSKTVAAERIRAAVMAGMHVLGENRVQEAAAKIPAVAGATWHLIGPLQANKARRALELFDVLESVHSLELARRLDRIAREIGRSRVPVLLQINVDRDPAKAGFDPADLEAATAQLGELSALDVRGLMTIGRLTADPEAARPTFVALRGFSEQLRVRGAPLGDALSMGMSDDYEIAVEEGATIVRVGRALFGERPGAGPVVPSSATG
jgi:pyridoxal phosphate enzyme (YggS family)